jgi:hypothetical protein
MNQGNTDYVSILLDIKSEVGSLNARLLDAAQSRQRMESSIKELTETVGEIKPVVAIVAGIKPEHDDLMKFKARIGSYIWLGGSIAMGAVYVLWQGLMFFSDNVKAGLGRMFH